MRIVSQPEVRSKVEAAAALVFGAYDGRRDHWQVPADSQLEAMSLGGTAGVVIVNLGGERLCAKLFYDARLKARLRNLVGFSKARRAYIKGRELARRQIPVPSMLGCAFASSGMGLLVTALADGYERLDKALAESSDPVGLLRHVGEFLRAMHAAGVTHADLSPRNLLVRSEHLLLLDYEDAAFHRRVSQTQVMDNLHHLHERLLAALPADERRSLAAGYADDANAAAELWLRMEAMLKSHPSRYTKAYWEQR